MSILPFTPGYNFAVEINSMVLVCLSQQQKVNKFTKFYVAAG